MKWIATIIVLIVGLYDQTRSCNRVFSGGSIAIQPLDSFDNNELNRIKKQIGEFWRKDVVILSPVSIPDSYRSAILNQYSADSMLELLSKIDQKKNRITVGLTHKNLYTVKEANTTNAVAYFDEGIFGMGYQPGNFCIVSDFKISSLDDTDYLRSLRNVILHEMGHNRGLSHCSDPACLMSDKASPAMLMKTTGFCKACRKKLKL